MTNFYEENFIMNRLQEHYEDVKKMFSEDKIVGIFLQGSQNYGLETETSDIDSKCIVLPSFKDILYDKPKVSKVYIRENNEHIDLKDIKGMFEMFRKQNPSFIEILFTKYKIINPLYEKFWNELIKNNELIALYNPYKAVSAMKGIAYEKYHAIEHKYPSRIEIINRFGGYDPKQLHHLLRMYYFIKSYTKGQPYSQCLRPEKNIAQFLITIKKYGVENGLEEARKWADYYFKKITQIAKDFQDCFPNENNPTIDFLLDDVQTKIMKKTMTIDLNKGV